ncbi:hypothetical protein BJ986_000206 [Phycicoccus badiiscoriae]|uniref:Uncharacterized protein n=1 Tax=Pedococcus badiiscoriae TaxID=642776 RepID=A0A852WA61_9MICO|nr:hypothetical protein [Pedococcus badiiscoriae]
MTQEFGVTSSPGVLSPHKSPVDAGRLGTLGGTPIDATRLAVPYSASQFACIFAPVFQPRPGAR